MSLNYSPVLDSLSLEELSAEELESLEHHIHHITHSHEHHGDHHGDHHGHHAHGLGHADSWGWGRD